MFQSYLICAGDYVCRETLVTKSEFKKMVALLINHVMYQLCTMCIVITLTLQLKFQLNMLDFTYSTLQ